MNTYLIKDEYKSCELVKRGLKIAENSAGFSLFITRYLHQLCTIRTYPVWHYKHAVV